MGEVKKPWESVTLWSNLAMAILALVVPAEYLSGEYKAMIIAGVNAVIRVVLTKTGIEL